MPVIDVQNLHIRYDKFIAVHDITFSVKSGQSMGILGGNGAGKSSTLKVLSGVMPSTSGKVFINDNDLSIPSQADEARKVIGYCPDVGGLIPQSTIREHIGLSLGLHGRTHMWPQALELVENFGLSEALDRATRGFSHGMSRRLSVVLAALASDKVIILDEPFDGVDPLGVEATLNLIDNAKKSGVAVIVSTHLQDLLAKATDDITIMIKGNIVEQDSSLSFEGKSGKSRYEKLLS